MIADINHVLDALCAKLGEDSCNYCLNIQLYPSRGMAGRSVTDTVTVALETTVVVGGTSSTDCTAFLACVEEAFEYAGDESSFPNRAFLASPEFQKTKAAVLKLLEEFVRDAGQLISFWLKEGHPFYPVFWDFAFVIEKSADAYVLIGSSSD